MTTYFISDIHLHAESKAQQKLLLEFLQTRGKTADAVYILGDLFAIWLGDDLHEPYSVALINTLQDLAAHKVPLYFMRGNRDFLIGKRFCRESGCKLLQDPCTIDLYGQKVLLTHGDQLCTLDASYQKFRRIVQNPILKNIFLLLPIRIRKKLGAWIKSKSHRPKDPVTYDVAQSTVNEWFIQHNVKTMIHGHTHMPAIHDVAGTKRLVLGDWTPSSAKILVATNNELMLEDLSSKQDQVRTYLRSAQLNYPSVL
ncbi:MAG TPA: UDP-2,3-diacylglucosamine diphosphatase [Gammaproteobacteria bacterium]|nr:UDP-2,3-diacylglucosamine diphosphatase [Gammaproteobacteria bacterium]